MFLGKGEMEENGLPCQGGAQWAGQGSLKYKTPGSLDGWRSLDPIRCPVNMGTDSLRFDAASSEGFWWVDLVHPRGSAVTGDRPELYKPKGLPSQRPAEKYRPACPGTWNRALVSHARSQGRVPCGTRY